LILLSVFLSALLTLCGTTLGFSFVFRTKRESHEPLFRLGRKTGDAFVQGELDDGVAVLERLSPPRGKRRDPVVKSLKGQTRAV
jgi:hypothetical protein